MEIKITMDERASETLNYFANAINYLGHSLKECKGLLATEQTALTNLSENGSPVVPAQNVPMNAAPSANSVPVVEKAAIAPTPVPTATPTPVPTAPPRYTIDMIAAAGSQLIDAGKLDLVLPLLDKYGVDSLSKLAPENYGAIAADLRALGARI